MPIHIGKGASRGTDYVYFLKTTGLSCTFHWNLRDVFRSGAALRETGSFCVGGTKWRLRLWLQDPFEIRLVSENHANVDVWFKATAINLQRRGTDQSMGRTMRFAPESVKGVQFIDLADLKNPEEGFLKHQCLAFIAEMTIIRSNGFLLAEPPVLSNRPVYVELLVDEDIRQHVDHKIRFGLNGFSRRCSYALTEQTFVADVQQKIRGEVLDRVRVWQCEQSQDGCLRLSRCLDCFPLTGITLGDLTDNDAASDDVWMQFYLESVRPNSSSPSLGDSLVFVKVIWPSLEEMQFAGSIIIREEAEIRDVMEAVRDLQAEGLAEMDMIGDLTEEKLYAEVDQIHLQPIDPALVASENGLHSGGVMVIDAEHYDYGGDLCNDVIDMFMRSLQLSEEDGGSSDADAPGPMLTPFPLMQPTTSKHSSCRTRKKQTPGHDVLSEEAEAVCVVCMDAPQTSGFVHENTSHKCVCRRCAKKFEKEGSLCPLCMARIQHVIYTYY